MARRFAEPDVARDHGAEHFFLEELPHVGRDLLAQVRPLVEHRQQHAFDVERGVERRAHAAHRADEIGEPFEREVFAVQRNQHRVGGDERVEREQSERRRAVDEDVVEVVAQRMRAARAAVLRARLSVTSSISAPVRLRSAGISFMPSIAGRDHERARVGRSARAT